MKKVCLHCDNTEFEEKEINATAMIKGEEIEVKSNAFVCNECGFELMDGKQLNALRKLGVDEYRRQNKLLTSEEIKGFRKNLKMTQEEFAKYIRVGVASVKRWEASIIVQDVGSNDLMRLKCNPQEASDNVIFLNSRIESIKASKDEDNDDTILEYG
jgi:putative zinc finger/helix-turn-helix YgiT family protein